MSPRVPTTDVTPDETVTTPADAAPTGQVDSRSSDLMAPQAIGAHP
jgi:hypothetical protein